MSALGFIGIILLIGAAARDDGTDWNPYLRSVAEIEGDWKAESTKLKIHDGRYECKGENCGVLGVSGTWEREGDFYIKAAAGSQKVILLRLGLRKKELVVATGADAEDPDLWNPKVKFVRAKPWNP